MYERITLTVLLGILVYLYICIAHLHTGGVCIQCVYNVYITMVTTLHTVKQKFKNVDLDIIELMCACLV